MNPLLPRTKTTARTLVEMLTDRATGPAGQHGYTFFHGDDAEDSWLRFAELHRDAKEVAGAVSKIVDASACFERDHQNGSAHPLQTTEGRIPAPRAVILCPPGSSYLKALFGTLYSGLIAVTAYPPRTRRNDARLDHVIADSGASIAMVDRSVMERRDQYIKSSPQLAGLHWIDVDSPDTPSRGVWQPPTLDQNDLAILQYTSGSTSQPKGVCLTHRNLMANLRMISEAFEVDDREDTWSVNWLPPYHDMGLIGGLLQVIYAGTCSHVMPPAAFIQNPIRWLRAIDRYRASISGGPNFAYDSCVKKIDARELSSIDLSSWTLAFCGAEPIRADSLTRFAQAFAACRFSPQAFFPCYGLAEATLLVSGGPRNRPLRTIARDDRSPQLASFHQASLVSCGRVADGQQVRIVAPDTNDSESQVTNTQDTVSSGTNGRGALRNGSQKYEPLSEGQVGEIWVSGNNISPGYWGKPRESEQTFAGRIVGETANFLKTGDLGFLNDGELFVCGRLKELIVIRGRNLHPSEIEGVVTACNERLIPNAAAAFEVDDDRGEVGLVVVAEADLRWPADETADLIRAIRRALIETFDLDPVRVVLIPSRTLSKTSSGKVMRLAMKERFLRGEFNELQGDSDGSEATRQASTSPLEDSSSSDRFRRTQGTGNATHGKGAPHRSESELHQWLVDRLARHLGAPCDQIDAGRPFVHYGLDSVSAVQMTGELESFLGQSISATLFYEAPTIRAVVRMLLPPPDTSTTRESTRNDSIDVERCVAIIGMDCRLPGCEGPTDYWTLIQQKRVAIGDLPTERMSDLGFAGEVIAGDPALRRAGWIEGPDRFDAALFGISPREACYIDPQHRLLLETSWRAIENAGIDPRRLAGTRTGAFVGISNRDYERLVTSSSDERSTYAMTGNAASMAAHRLSFHLDLQGPSLAVDTACSSSLVALHQAVRAIQSGDCDASLVAGVNLILGAEVSETLNLSQMLSPEGLCKTFDAGADGYVRGEGCVALLIKPLAKALADGDPIRAVIRGTAINQDGQTNGITAPNGQSQVRLYRDALADARLAPEQITRIEAHGTGTPLGDPIEVRSLMEVYGNHDAVSSHCFLGAVKANIGHLEAAAGLASVLKVVLELEHLQVAGQPNLSRLNPEIRLDHSRIKIPTDNRQWTSSYPHIAAVSSFGFGGTNAHVILSELSTAPPEPGHESVQSAGTQLVTVSAFDTAALRSSVDDQLEWFRRQPVSLEQFAQATQRQKTSHRHRVAVLGERRSAVAEALQEFTANRSCPSQLRGIAPADHPFSVAFLFSGQGGQYVGMGRALYQRSAIFRDWVDRCDELLEREFATRVGRVISSDPATNGAVAEILAGAGSQTALFILQLSLAKMLQEWGVRPTIVLGHSMGEYAAAAVAGVMSWDDALRLTAARASRIAELPSTGAMAVVFASMDEVQQALQELNQGVSVAAIDAPDHIVVSGPATAIQTLRQQLHQQGTETRPLRITHAFHSAQIEPALDEVGLLTSRFVLNRPGPTYISTLTGRRASEELLVPDYWIQHSRQPVQYVSAIQTLVKQPCDIAIEIGPHPTLCTLAQLNGTAPFPFVPTLDRKRDAWTSILETLGNLFVRGADPDWSRIQTDTQGPEAWYRQPRLILPGHPFQRQRFWIQPGQPKSNSQPHSAASSCGVKDVLRQVKRNLSQTTAQDAQLGHDVRLTAQAAADVDRLVAIWIQVALTQLRIGTQKGELLDPSALIATGRIAPRHGRLLGRLFVILQQEGLLEAIQVAGESPTQWKVVRPWRHDPVQQSRFETEVARRHPNMQHMLHVAMRCARALPDVLSGRVDPLEVLFPAGSTSDLEKIYRESPLSVACNRVVAQTAQSIVELLCGQSNRSPSLPIRVLEVGGGTGGTTASVLPAIRDAIDQFVFTDTSPLLIEDTRARMGEAITYSVLDIESSPAKQGFADQSFDIILAANVLHATRDLAESLGHVRQLLRDGGFLIAVEGIRRERLLDLIFGLTDGWWRFQDVDLRPDYPLIDEATWFSLLSDCGFADPCEVPFSESTVDVGRSQIVLLANVKQTEPLPSLAPSTERDSVTLQSVAASLQPWIEAFHAGAFAQSRDVQQGEAIEGYLRQAVGAILGFAPDALDVDQPVSNLGIDSLMAIQLKNRLQHDLGISIPMVTFLQGKTVRQLIDAAMAYDQDRRDAQDSRNDLNQRGDQHRRDDQGNPLEKSQPQFDWSSQDSSNASKPSRAFGATSDTASVAPIVTDTEVALIETASGTATTSARVLGSMSVGQLALWMIHQRSPDGPAYNFAFAARTNRAMNLPALVRACQSLLKRHPVLRTRYQLQGDQAVRVLSDSNDVLIVEKDCNDWKEVQILDWVRSEADRPFDLHHGPVIRFSLLRCRSGDVLAIAMHHIAADLWSMDVLIQELIDLYAMIVGGGSIELGTLPTTYDAYVDWEQRLEASDEGQRLWDFWQSKLEGAPPILALPTTYSRPPEQTFRGDAHSWSLPVEVLDGLREVAQAERTTLFTIVLTAYQIFLSRICQQDDLLVGTISASRGRAEWEGIVGYFLNQLVLRTRLNGSPSYRDVLRDTQREVLDALEHQAFPFAKLVEKIRPPRDASRSPLVQTMFIWDKPRQLKESHFAPGKSRDRLRLKPLLMEQRGAPFDLTLIVFELEDELKLTFRYNVDLFSADAIKTLAESFQALVEAIANDPDLPVRSAPLLPPGQEGLIASWNATETPFDPRQSGDAWFKHWVQTTPDQIAIETADQRWTYSQADRRVTAIARALKQHGVTRGDTVALWACRGAESILGILGIWRAGAAYVPLDPDHPLPRLQSVCDDAVPRAFLGPLEYPLLDSLSLACPRVDWALDDPCGQSQKVTELPEEIDPESPAYLIYTSGSTGRPKGVVLAHRGLANLAAAQRDTFGVLSNDRCLQFASLSFDASVFEMMMAFHAGATLFVLDASTLRSTTSEISSQLRQAGVTVATLPPSLLAALPSQDLPKLRLAISAGEACTSLVVEKWSNGRKLFNAYGPTETTVWATTELCVNDGRDPTLGRPINNFQAYVVDAGLEPMPIGIPGELCLRGPGLAVEYRNLPVLTADAFVPNPFDSRFDATMYRTGDRVRWTHAGKLEFLGRIDDQLKIDGHRIEPGEIASVIRQLDGVENAFVTSHDHDGNRQLVAYLCLRDSTKGSNTDRDLRSVLLGRLPAYMVPRQFVFVDTLPLTVNGKVDATRLPRPSNRRDERDEGSGNPTTQTERALAQIWRTVLRREAIRVDDNFFELGGASLQALQAADLAQKQGYPASAENLFQFQTIAELAAHLDAVDVNASAVPANSLAVVDSRDQAMTDLKGSTLQRSGPDADTLRWRMVVESLGVYLPPLEVTTKQVVDQCRKRLDFPLQRMTGIETRRMAGEDEFSIDLARKAALDCLSRSRYRANEIDLLIACNISRCDGPDFQITFEPSTASRLKHQIGADFALAFDIGNACAGFFTALSLAEAELRSGNVRRAMIVSGEYITHLTRTAQLELDGFLDPRLACLTLGDAGAAVIVELADDGSGFQTLDLYTAGGHHDLCVAKATNEPHGGAIMLTDAVRASAITLQHSMSHAHSTLSACKWSPRDVQHLIMHQTSSTTIDGAVEEMNRFFGESVCDATNTINNLARRGNTASTTHWVALMDAIQSGRVRTGDNVVFAVSGSGQTVGTALYKLDSLPDRILHGSSARLDPHASNGEAYGTPLRRFGVRLAAAVVEPVGHHPLPQRAPYRVVESAMRTAKSCVSLAEWQKDQVELLMHAGVYRDEYLSEPAVAAILAGELEINHECPDPSAARTLAFDVSDSSRGVFSAIRIASTQIGVGNVLRSLITASEIETNSDGDQRRGIAELASALALERTSDGEEGFCHFSFYDSPQYSDRLHVTTKMDHGCTHLVVHKAPDLSDALLQCVVAGIQHHLYLYRCQLKDFGRVLVAAPLAEFRAQLAHHLGISEQRLLISSGSFGEDPFTSGIAQLWLEAHRLSKPRFDERWLIVSAGAGIEVGCVEYRFREQETTR